RPGGVEAPRERTGFRGCGDFARLSDDPGHHRPVLGAHRLREPDRRRPVRVHRPASEVDLMAIPAVAVGQAAIDWEVPEQQIGLWSDAWTRFRRNRLAVLGLGLVTFLILVALVSPLLVNPALLL